MFNINEICDNEYSALIVKSTETPLDDYGRPCGPEVEVDNDISKDFHFPDAANFFDNIEEQTGVPAECIEISAIPGDPGVLRLSYPSIGDNMYDKDEPTCIFNIYYRIFSPAGANAIKHLLFGDDASYLNLGVEHLALVEDDEVEDDDLGGCDFHFVESLDDIVSNVGDEIIGYGDAPVDIRAVKNAPGVVALDYDCDGEESTVYVRLMAALSVDELEEMFPVED